MTAAPNPNILGDLLAQERPPGTVIRLSAGAVTFRVVDGEAVMLDIERSEYLGLNSTATALLEAIQHGATTEELVATLLERFEVAPMTAARDVEMFLDRVRAEGLARALSTRARLLCSPSCLATMAWAVVAVRLTRHRVGRDGLRGTPPPSTWLPVRGEPGVVAVLNRLEPTCLERSLVLQRWLADHGRPLDVIIGVKQDDEVRAHAWLEPEPNDGYFDLHRLAPPVRRRA